MRSRIAGRSWRLGWACLVVSALGLAGAGSASAIDAPVTFNVTRFDDPAGGSCTPGACSLRQAIAAANGRNGHDTIEIPAGTVVLDPARPQLTVTRDGFTIEGAGARSTAISGADAVRVLTVSFGLNATSTLTIQKLAVVHGSASGAGAGIAVDLGKVHLDQVALTDNHALADGGGMAVDAGSQVTVTNSLVARNTASGNGGGIHVARTSTNPVVQGSTVVVDDSTISGNSANLGGGIMVTAGDTQSHPFALLRNATVAGNGANAGGNLERESGSSGNVDGGVNIANTIIGPAARGGGCDGGLVDGGHNIDAGGDCGGLIPANNHIGVDPLLGPLADNGGPTDTQLLRPGSVAIDGGSGCVNSTDQRGVNRGDGAHHTGGSCDIGAYEAIQATDLGITNSSAPSSVAAGSNVAYTLTVTSTALSPPEPSEAAQPVVQDTLPAGTTLVSATPSQGSCSGTTTVTCTLGHLSDGASAQVTLVATTGSAGTLSDTATVTSPRKDVNAANDSATASTTVTPNQPNPAPAFTGGLKLSPSSFAAANSGPTAARATGTTVRYTLTQAATVTFTVQRPQSGRKVGKRCVKPTKGNRKKRKCTRFVKLGRSFQRPSTLGANRFHFSGRLNGKKLKPGTYRLVGVATNSAGKRSKAVSAAFRIKK